MRRTRSSLPQNVSGDKVVPERLATRSIDAGASLYRCHSMRHRAIHFGRDSSNRFDDPENQFGVCYLSLSPSGAFAETLIRKPTGQLLEKSDLRNFGLTTIRTGKPLRLVQCHGKGLKLNGMDSRISSHTDRGRTQALARALHDHGDLADGLIYRARHDDDQFSIALFDRASSKLTDPGPPIRWIDAGLLLEAVLDRYGIALIDRR